MAYAAAVTVAGLLLSWLAPARVASQPASSPPCAAAEYRQFDFWLGEWTVEQRGRQAGTSAITRILDGCVIHEAWSSAGRSRGQSFNRYDRASREWIQTWVDNDGQSLSLRGGLRGVSMVLEGSRPGPSGGTVVDRITWTPLDGGGVRQHWEASTDGRVTWTDQFDGFYRRRP